MLGFGKYLKEYLEFNNLSQTEFASRLGITQKHMNEILNGKMSITLERAAQIYHLTGIPIDFIINAENRKLVTEYLFKKFAISNNLNVSMGTALFDNIIKNLRSQFATSSFLVMAIIIIIIIIRRRSFWFFWII